MVSVPQLPGVGVPRSLPDTHRPPGAREFSDSHPPRAHDELVVDTEAEAVAEIM